MRTQIVKAGAASQLSVVHDGQEIKSNITAAHIAIWNQGRESIRQADMLSPLVIFTENHTPILEATIQRMTRDVIRLRLDESLCAMGQLGVHWEILEESDGGVVQIIYRGPPDLQIEAHAIAEGQRQILHCAHIIPTPTGNARAERALCLSLFCLLVPGMILTLFSMLGPLLQVFPFVGSPPPSPTEVVADSLGTLFGVIAMSTMLWGLRTVRPPFEF